VAKCRSTGGTADTNAVTIDGWTTSSSTYIKIWTDPDDPYGRHNGKWDEGKYRIIASPAGNEVIVGEEDYVYIDGLQVELTGSDDDKGGLSGANWAHSKISNCIVRNTSTGTLIGGIRYTAYMWNNIVYNFNTTGSYGFRSHFSSSYDTYMYNNTVYGCTTGYTISSNNDASRMYIKGNLWISNGTDFYSAVTGFAAFNNNVSSDSTAGNFGGSNNKVNQTVKFLDAANDDFHLDPTDTAARNAGTSTVIASEAWQSRDELVYDIDGTLRGGAWDIGADEVPVEYVSTICENTSAGGDCATADYSRLYDWEADVNTDLTASTTRVFSGTLIGTLADDADVTLVNPDYATTTITGKIAATTSDQILIYNIANATTPLTVASGTKWCADTTTCANYWLIQGATTTDELGASPIAVAKIDGSWSNADTQAVDIDGWTTDQDNYIKIYTTDLARHNGKWDTNAYRLKYSATANTQQGIYIEDRNTRLEGLQISVDANGYSFIRGIRYAYIESGDSNSQIAKCIIKGVNSPQHGIYVADLDLITNNINIWNNIIYSFDYGIFLNDNSSHSNFYIYNNTIYNNGTGIYRIVGTVIVKNNLIASTADPFYGTFTAGTDYNATDNSDTPGVGTHNITNATINFVSTASGTEDFHLTENNPDIINAGTDLSNDAWIPASAGMTEDVDGSTKNVDGLGWDIGADEVPTKIYRSVGNTSGDLSNGGTVTISSTTRTATFSTAQPDNIGVGDVIQYGGAGYYQLAFITARASSTVYYVQSATGGAPTATTSASMQIFRAHLKLADWESQSAADVNADIDADLRADVLVGQDLVSSGTIMMVPCYASTNGDDERVTIESDSAGHWNTSEQDYIKIYTPVYFNEVGTSQRHSGKWTNNAYRLEYTAVNYLSALIVYTDYVKIDGLQISLTTNGNNLTYGVVEFSNSGKNYFSNNIVKGSLSGGGSFLGGVRFNSVSIDKIWNNVVYDISNASGIFANRYSDIYNNTVYNCGTGYEGIYSSNTFYNNIAQNCTDGFSISSATSDYNISNLSGDAPGTHSKNNTTVKFVDAANDDFHLDPTDTAAIDAGTSTVVDDIADLRYDIDGHYRRGGPASAGFDIGADEASVYFVSTVMEDGGDFSSLSAWENANQVDLTATTTAVFSCSEATGTIPVGSSVIGETSGTMASTTVMSTSSNQILLYNIGVYSASSSAFISGEKVYILGGSTTTNYCILSNAGNPVIAAAKIDGTWTNADTNAVDIDGWTTGEYNYIKIYTTDTARHRGKWDEGKYRLENSNASAGIIRIKEDYTWIDGLQIYNTYIGSYTNRYAISINYNGADGAGSRISNNIIKGIAGGTGKGVSATDSVSKKIKIWNNIVYDFENGECICVIRDSSSSDGDTNYVYNNTVYNCDIGFCGNADYKIKTVVKNNIAQNCNVGFGSHGSYNYFDSSSDYNISSDGTAPGAHSLTNATVSFVDADNDDFHLMPTSAGVNAGCDLTRDCFVAGAPRNDIEYDIDGDERYDTGWDIGADEAPTILYRSVGLHSGDLNTNGATVTIATSTNYVTATFSSAMPDNVGVGDVIQYGNPLILAFITGRISSSSYYIQSATGSPPIATTSAPASIYRAHLHLDDWEDQVVGDVNQSINVGLQSDVLVGQNLVASNTAMFVPCYASTSADNLAVAIDGWTTGTSSYIKIYTPVSTSEVGESQRHNGKWSDSKYRLQPSIAGASAEVIGINSDFIRLEGLQVYAVGNTDIQSGMIIYGDGEIYVTHNIVKASLSGDVTAGYGISGHSTSYGNHYIFNNIVYNWINGTSSVVGISGYSSKIVKIYNNTVYNCFIGIRRGGGSNPIIKNNAVFGCNDDLSDILTVLDHNASDDLDGTNAVDISPCPVESDCWKGMFVDYENGDFRIRDTHSVLYDTGVAISDVTDDILGIARPQGDAYDIGAFEYTGTRSKYRFSPGGTFKFRGKFRFR
jgi:hypothetical protein